MDAHERLDGLLDETRLTGRSHRPVVGQFLRRDPEAERRRYVSVDAVGAGRRGVVVGRFVFVAAAQRLVR